MVNRVPQLLVSIAAVALIACGDDASGTSTTPDTRPDASPDVGPPISTDTDAGTPRDTTTEDTTSEDSAPDADADAIGDAEVDRPEAIPFAVVDLYVDGDASDFEYLYAHPQDHAVEIDVEVRVDDRRYRDVEMEVHGGLARTFPKLSFRLRFHEDDPLETVAFSETPERHRRVVLQASWIDPTYTRNCATLDLVREHGGLAPRCQYANLWLNETYHGFYALIERVDEEYLTRQGFDRDGLLLKAESHHANWGDKSDPLEGFSQKGNDHAPSDALGELLGALTWTATDFDSFEAHVVTRLDLDDFLAWQTVHTLADNRDTFTKNYYLYHDLDEDLGDPDARFRLISWDADATWGLNWDGKWLDTDEVTWHGTDEFSLRLYEIDAYKATYRYAFLNGLSNELSPATIVTRVAASSSRVREAALADLSHWGRDEIDFDNEIQLLNNAVQARHDVMMAVLEEL